MTTAGGIGHTLPFLIKDFHVAFIAAVIVVAMELATIAWIRNRYMDTPLLSAAFQVAKVDLAYRAVHDGVFRTEDGRLLAHSDEGEVPLKEYLSNFVSENPEFLPARISGGSGITAAHKAPRESTESVDIENIRPGMSSEQMERVRKEILRVA